MIQCKVTDYQSQALAMIQPKSTWASHGKAMKWACYDLDKREIAGNYEKRDHFETVDFVTFIDYIMGWRPEPVIEINVKINGKNANLSDISEQCLIDLRKYN